MIDIVIPTVGRPSLSALLESLGAACGPLPSAVIVVDDRRDRSSALELGTLPDGLAACIRVVAGRAAGPASARNIGWRAARSAWIAFLDDDVLVNANWLSDLATDLADCSGDVAASQGRLHVPLPARRRPTDWERNVAALEAARWITADCAYRRADLIATGGFDERFPRAYREDADLALRVVKRGRRIVDGKRRSLHPVRPAGPFISIALQAGNADDVLMEALHGADWYERAGASRGTIGRHQLTVTCAALAAISTAAWVVATLDFAYQRIAPGPRTPREVWTMLVTSAVIPFAAVGQRMRGRLRLRTLLATGRCLQAELPRAVLFDRDGTLVVDVPHNADPQAVEPMAGARLALERLRAAGIATGIVSNAGGVALGKLTVDDVAAVNARVAELLGPFDTVQVCPHAPGACDCRKPAPGMIYSAARALGIDPAQCVVIGDIGADVDAALAAGARAILVPTALTRAAEIANAPEVARTLAEAVDRVLAVA